MEVQEEKSKNPSPQTIQIPLPDMRLAREKAIRTDHLHSEMILKSVDPMSETPRPTEEAPVSTYEAFPSLNSDSNSDSEV